MGKKWEDRLLGFEERRETLIEDKQRGNMQEGF